MKTIVIYATKYGSTKKIAENIAAVIPEAECRAVSELDGLDFEAVVLGTPVYAGRFLPEMSDFLQKHKSELEKRKLFFFIVCADKGSVRVNGQETGGAAFLHQINDFLQQKIISSRAFWGRMIKEQLAEEDKAVLDEFSNILGVEFPDFDRIETEEAREFGREIKGML